MQCTRGLGNDTLFTFAGFQVQSTALVALQPEYLHRYQTNQRVRTNLSRKKMHYFTVGF